MGYEGIDGVIADWAKRRGLEIGTAFDRRYSYVSGSTHESFQISIEPPDDGAVTINAWDVETEDGAELHRQWRVSIEDLAPTLDAALGQIADWTSRPRTRQWGDLS